MAAPRIPFIEAINEPLLFAKPFARLSTPQQMILKAIYGVPLTEEELVYWSAFSGEGIYDELGFLVGVRSQVPYIPQEYRDITLIIGRRGAKSSVISSCCVAYEALCGGHKDAVGSRQDPVFLQVAQDLATARANLRQFILEWLAESPVGKKELEAFGSSAITADSIRLRRGLITVGPPTMKLRGAAIACCAMDELCVWAKDREASNPDIEVQRAVEPALTQFMPFAKLIKTSTPMTEEGLLWEAAQIGTGGKYLSDPTMRAAHSHTLVLTAPTAAMDNPVFRRLPGGLRSLLAAKRAKDVDAFEREYLARFSKSVSGFLNQDLLRESILRGVDSHPPAQRPYVAVMDPAFRRDAFAFTIGHLEGGDFVQDYIHAWRGIPGEPLRPGAVLDEIQSICFRYGIRVVVSDQFHNETLSELASARGLVIEYCPMTLAIKGQMWTDFNSMLMQRKLKLLDHGDLLNELSKMERKITKFGNTQYAGSGARDDLAMVTALAVHKALQQGEPIRRAPERLAGQPSMIKRRVQARARQGREGEGESWWIG